MLFDDDDIEQFKEKLVNILVPSQEKRLKY